MSTAEDLGVDDRARKLLDSLPAKKQEAILQKLALGIEEGKIRNPSAFVASACQKPEALGIDDRAAELLKQLPPARRKEVLEKLKNAEGIKNPSAWVASQCLKDAGGYSAAAPPSGYSAPAGMVWQLVSAASAYGMKGYGGGPYGAPYGAAPYGKGGKGGCGFSPRSSILPSRASFQSPGLDAQANKLLQTLPPSTRKEILAKLKQETGIRNPSAWVVKQALAAGAQPNSSNGDPGLELDDEAQELLSTLPENTQQEILDKLRAESGVRNPSAWVAKNALRMGATPRARGGVALGVDLDDEAQDLLSSLPESAQQEVLDKLRAETGIRNPSAWVAKTALRMGATPRSRGGPPVQTGGLDHLGLDDKAQDLLSQCQPEQQEEILAKLEDMIASGQCRNPSGFVVRQALNAGATPNSGPAGVKGGSSPGLKGKGARRSSPY